MSISRNPGGEKIVLPRSPDEFWLTLQEQWAGDDQMRWKYLAVLHLRVHCGWKLEMIGAAFGHPKGHISRIIKNTIVELRALFKAPWNEWEKLADENDDEMQLCDKCLEVAEL